jgi:hypothetical protein
MSVDERSGRVLGEVLEVIGHVFASGGGEVEVMDLIDDFTDRRGHDYVVDLRRYGAYMFATLVVCQLFGVS